MPRAAWAPIICGGEFQCVGRTIFIKFKMLLFSLYINNFNLDFQNFDFFNQVLVLVLDSLVQIKAFKAISLKLDPYNFSDWCKAIQRGANAVNIRIPILAATDSRDWEQSSRLQPFKAHFFYGGYKSARGLISRKNNNHIFSFTKYHYFALKFHISVFTI